MATVPCFLGAWPVCQGPRCHVLGFCRWEGDGSHGPQCVVVGPGVSCWQCLVPSSSRVGLPPRYMSPTCWDNVTRCHPWRGHRGYEGGAGCSSRLSPGQRCRLLRAWWLQLGEQACSGVGCLYWGICVMKYLGFGVSTGCWLGVKWWSSQAASKESQAAL